MPCRQADNLQGRRRGEPVKFTGSVRTGALLCQQFLAYKKEKRSYKYLALPGIGETVRDILMNLSSVVLVGMPIGDK